MGPGLWGVGIPPDESPRSLDASPGSPHPSGSDQAPGSARETERLAGPAGAGHPPREAAFDDLAQLAADMMMPVMAGAALVLWRGNPSVRLIAASGFTADSNMARAAGVSVKHFLAKPCSGPRPVDRGARGHAQQGPRPPF